MNNNKIEEQQKLMRKLTIINLTVAIAAIVISCISIFIKLSM